jgi:hypothetical protein
VRQVILSALVAVLALIVGAGAPPAFAHDEMAPASTDGGNTRTKDAKAEAGQLTDELRNAGKRKSTVPAVQAAVAGQAERRRDLLKQLSESNPAAVLELALSQQERDALPPPIKAMVEERVNVDGELQVLHFDFEDGHSTYESKLVKGKQETPVKFGAALKNVQPGDTVTTSGVALAGDGTVITDQMVTTQSATAVGTTGQQRTAIVLIKASNASSHPYSGNKTATANLFFDASAGAKSARAFYLESSYGQTTIVGGGGAAGSASDVYGPFTIASTSCGDSGTIRSQALTAADSAINYNQYNRIVLSIANPSCGSGGIGTIRSQGVSTNDGPQSLSISWDFNNALGSLTSGKIGGVALHEYGHNIGVWHANSLECGAESIGSDECNSPEYGDPSDVMGNSGGFGHFNGVHKDILGWLGSREQIASTNGTYPLNAYEDGVANVKVLKVPRTRDTNGTVNGYYYLETRRPTANWNTFASSRPEYGQGVLVHVAGTTPLCTSVCDPDFTGGGGGGDSNIIDAKPGTLSGTNDFNDAPLTEGETYFDEGAGVTMQVTSTGATGASVALAFSTPRRSIQSVVYPAGAGTVSGGGVYSPGESVTLTASPVGCFDYWREKRTAQTFPNPYTFTVGADRSLEAIFTTGTCTQPPANDTFPGASVSGGQQAVTTTSATTQSGEPTGFTCSGSSVTVGRTAWYTITPSSAAQITLSTAGSTFDTVLAVYTGDAVNALTPVTCNDDVVSGNTASQVQFAAQAGTPYRVQLSGYNGDSGNGVLAISSAVMESDPRQEGAIQVGGNLKVGSSASITVAVKNYSSVATPPLHPIVDGTMPSGAAWHATTAQPASATIQPGQTATFTLLVPITTLGQWSTTGVSLWNDATGALWKPLPANGQSQKVTFAATIECNAPRPKVGLQTSVTGDGRMAVTLSVGAPETGNRLTGLQFGADSRTPYPNALIDLPGIGNGRTATMSAALPGNPTTYTFYISREKPSVPLTLPLTVTDYCGSWQTVVGGGTSAGF